VVVFDKFRFDSPRSLLDPAGLKLTLSFLRDLHQARYDAVVLLHHLTTAWGAWKHGLLVISTAARYRAGLDNGRGWFLNRRVRDRGFGALHEADYARQIVATLGATVADFTRPTLYSAQDTAKVRHVLEGFLEPSIPLVAVHPGSGWYCLARRWPVERFAEVTNKLSEAGARVLLLGGPDEVDLVARLEGLTKGAVLNLAGKTSLKELAAVLGECDVFVGNDSGVMHVAAAVGTPVVAVFGPSNYRAWGPYPGWETRYGEGIEHVVVRVDCPCGPCLYRGFELGRRDGCAEVDCLREISAEMVYSEAISKLEKVRAVRTAVP
jgi:ADP-heptose:LPS heptosyltransferase